MKSVKLLSWFLGVSMFMVGFLKFFNPFKGWYATQVANSGLESLAYGMGIVGELSVGVIFLFCMIYARRASLKIWSTLIITASAVVVIMMAVGIFVHVHPNVPAEVLPLKIKPPFIPGMFLVLGLLNIYLTRKVN